MRIIKTLKATGDVLTGVGQFYQLSRELPCNDLGRQRSQFDGTVFGLLLSAAESGDRVSLFQCIAQIEYSHLRATCIFARPRPTRAELLSAVQGFLRYFGLEADSKLLLDYRHSVSRIGLAKSCRSASCVQ